MYHYNCRFFNIKNMFNFLKRKQDIDVQHLPKQLQKLATTKYRKYNKWLQENSGRFTKRKIIPKYVFTDRSGRNWYVIDDFNAMTHERANAIENALQAVNYGATNDFIVKTMQSIATSIDKAVTAKDGVLKSNHRAALQIATAKAIEVQQRIENLTPEQITLRLAVLMHVTDDENPYVIDNELNEQKLRWIRNDKELKSFFLKTSMLTFEALTKRNGTEYEGKVKAAVAKNMNFTSSGK